jgi:hypothetical protein
VSQVSGPWAYYKAGRIADARRVIARALRTGTKDASIRAHAAAIGSAAGGSAAPVAQALRPADATGQP